MTDVRVPRAAWIVAWALLCLLAPNCAHAQGGATGALSGTVEDSTGAVIGGATVKVVNAATGETLRSETTDSSGLFTVALLPAGTYSLQVSSPGFAETTVRSVLVRVTETTRLIVTLNPKSVTETVEVRSEAVTVNTVNATTGESLGGQEIGELPLATRNFQQLLALSAGASSSLNAAAQLGRGVVKIQVNGGREDDNNYQIEGIGANDATNTGELANTPLPSPDAIQEFKVATSLYDATQGRNGGGNINAVLKSGTSALHFDAFEYFRNTVLDANDFFLKEPIVGLPESGLPRPVIQQNIFGGSVGGPVGDKAKLGYFFLNYQGTRQRSGDSPGTIISTNIPYVPASARTSPAALLSAFASEGVTSIDPVAYALLAARSNQFGPNAGGYTYPLPTMVPAGTVAGDLVPFRVSLPGRFEDNQFTANWDRDFRGGKDRLSWRFFWSDSSVFQPFGGDSFQLLNGGVGLENNLDFPLDQPLHNRFGSLAETHIFNDHLVNEARFGVNIIGFKFLNEPPANTSATALGIDRPSNNVSNDMYRIVFSDINVQMGPFPSEPVSSLADGLTFLDTLSYTLGSHSFRFGGEIDHQDVRRFNPIDDDGFLFFVPFAPGQPTTGFANFLEGNIAPGSLAASGLANHDYKIPEFSLFTQDDYRATKTLTLNLGFRLEFVGAPYDALCHQGNVNPALAAVTGQPFFWPKCIDQFRLPGVVGTAHRSGLNNDYATVAEPRIGLAYDVLGHHTTSIRAGYGIYSVREDIGSLENMILTPPTMPQVAPVGIPPGGLSSVFVTPPNQLPAIGQLSAAFVPQPTFFTGFSTSGACTGGADATNNSALTPCFSGNVESFFAPEVPLHYVAPTIQQWNLSIERSLGMGWTLQVGYVGTKGTHLREVADTDQARLASPSNPIIIPNINCAGTLTGPGQSCAITENTALNIAARVPYLGISPFGYERFGEDADSNYNGLQVTVAHRFAKSLSVQSSYTYSKAIDDTSSSSVAFDTRLNNQLNGIDSRGPSDFDRRHRWILNYDYEIPFAKNNPILGGWDVSGVFTLQSGTPFTVVDSFGGSVYGLSSPDLVTPDFAPGFSCANSLNGGSIEEQLRSGQGYINSNAFVPAPAAPFSDGSTGFGDVPRNCFHGPRQINLDFSIGKSFRLGEHQQLRFTTEFFNLTNTPSFANPAVTDIESAGGNATFGPINQLAGTPRLIQFALRYSY